MERLGPPAEHPECALCAWRSETDWAPCDQRAFTGGPRVGRTGALAAPIMAEWLAPAFSGVRQN